MKTPFLPLLSSSDSLARFFLSLLLCGSLLSFSACTKDDDDEDSSSRNANACDLIGLETKSGFARIINGIECEFGKSPVVFLKIGRAACTGTVISSSAVLTAAHCFLEGTNQPVTISSGSASNVVGFANRVVVHPQAKIDNNANLYFNDVAIVFSSGSLNLPSLPLIVSRSPRVGDEMEIYGYGQSETVPSGSALDTVGQLRAGTSEITDVSPTHLFSEFTGDASNSCFGDSGGPALQEIDKNNSTVVGIVGTVSGGTSASCAVGDLSNYIRIDSVVITDFIVSQVPDVKLE